MHGKDISMIRMAEKIMIDQYRVLSPLTAQPTLRRRRACKVKPCHLAKILRVSKV
jgi:hypothetical protein